MTVGGGAAAWASEGAARNASPLEDGAVAPISEVAAESLETPGAPFLVEGAWFVLEVRPGQILLTVKSDTEGEAGVAFEIPALRTWNHGGYVSALAKALEPGPRRGQIVSALARSSVGRADKPDKPDKPEKPEKPDRPESSGTSAEVGENGVGDAEDGESGVQDKAFGKDKAPGKDEAPGKDTTADKDKAAGKARGSSRGN